MNVLDEKYVIVLEKSDTGRNVLFYDPFLNIEMTLLYFVYRIKLGKYPGYHIRLCNGIETPCSNPDDSTANNLG